MKIQLADGLPYHPTMRHPHTGKALRALYVRSNGTAAWPVMGASADEETTTEASEGTEEGEEADGTGEGDKKPELTAEQRRIAELEEELSKVKSHRSAADRKREEKERELNELKNKDLPEVERLKKELEEAKATGTKSEASFKGLALTNAFLMATQRAKITWHDPDVAKAAAKLADLEVGEDGSVEGIDKIVKDLAKSKPFLVDGGKPAEDKEKTEEKKKNGASGSAVGSGGGNGKGEPGKPTREQLLSRFPALRK